MIRYRLKELIEDYEARTGQKLSYTKLARETGLNRPTISKLITQRGYNTTTTVLDRLCDFFECSIEDLIEHVPSNDIRQHREH
ncbi:MAG: helix-turn-helix domain-containing protein [Pseudomonadota bacterium]